MDFCGLISWQTEGNMWRSDSDVDSSSDDDISDNASPPPERQRSMSVPPESFSEEETNALFEISKCMETTITKTTHQNIFRFPRAVLIKMVEVRALVPGPNGARGNSYQVLI
jgi:hypothetical protein